MVKKVAWRCVGHGESGHSGAGPPYISAACRPHIQSKTDIFFFTFASLLSACGPQNATGNHAVIKKSETDIEFTYYVM